MAFRLTSAGAVLACGCLLMFAGCGPGEVKSAKVTGKVTHQSQPVTEGTVHFIDPGTRKRGKPVSCATPRLRVGLVLRVAGADEQNSRRLDPSLKVERFSDRSSARVAGGCRSTLGCGGRFGRHVALLPPRP